MKSKRKESNMDAVHLWEGFRNGKMVKSHYRFFCCLFFGNKFEHLDNVAVLIKRYVMARTETSDIHFQRKKHVSTL